MLILSIDVGIINIGMCMYNTSTKKIHYWDVGGIPPENSKGLYPCLFEYFKSKEWINEPDMILLEKQPDKNKKMKSVEHFIHTFFLCMNKTVRVYDARHKIPDVVGPGKKQYAKRKQTSVIRCREILNENNKEWIEFFNSYKKKDDLADAFMQVLSLIPSEPSKNKNPRKPTLNQKNTVYSRSNLAWIIKNNQPQDARFHKDLKKYYSSITDLKSEYNLI